MNIELTNRQKRELNDFGNLFSYIHTEHSAAYLNADYDIIFVNKGNQAGGTAVIAYGFVLRILGWHPIPRKNMTYWKCEQALAFEIKEKANESTEGMPRGHYFTPKEYMTYFRDKNCPECGSKLTQHHRRFKIYRFASQSLPTNKNSSGGDASDRSGEVVNTQYPEFTRWLPPFLLKKDITARSSTQIIIDPYGGEDIIIEYVSYNQPAQRVAGHKRTGLWLDELAPEPFYDEQPARLMLEDGDISISYTPTMDNGISYYFDRIYEKAKVYYRSKTIREYYKRKHGIDYPMNEFTNSKESICVISMATDDNPCMAKEVIEKKYAALDDPELQDMRRYGIFAAVTGKIYKQFVPRIHIVNSAEIFPNGIPEGWRFYRAEDYHPDEKLAIIFVTLSPFDEAFVYAELNPDPNEDNTLSVCDMIADVSGPTRKFVCSLIDPLAAIKQSNTSKSVIEDMNHYMRELKRNGDCTGGVWESANTKQLLTGSNPLHNLRGRDQIKLRLVNAAKCGKPYNNEIMEDGLKKRLPTLWLLNNCPEMANSLRSWRIEKGKPTKKWSHFCTALEFLAKDIRFKARNIEQKPRKKKRYVHKRYYQTARRS